MPYDILKKYIKFIHANRQVYLTFNKQLLLSGFAGLFVGIGIAEAVAFFTRDEIMISVASGTADYIASIIGFLGLYYHDNRHQYSELCRKARFKKIMRDVLWLWPSVVAADIVYIILRPYIHSIFLFHGFEAGISAAVAHFIGVGIFNGIALLSRSIIDYSKSKYDCNP